MTSPTTSKPSGPKFDERSEETKKSEKSEKSTQQPSVAANRFTLIPREKHSSWLTKLARSGGLAGIEDAVEQHVRATKGL